MTVSRHRAYLINVFIVTNRVGQGGILSPLLFTIYMDDLWDIFDKSTTSYMQMTYIFLVFFQQIYTN